MSNILLCDIGNRHFHFFDEKRGTFSSLADGFKPFEVKDKVYYICVNEYWQKYLQKSEKWVDIAKYINYENYYESMGIDRIVCCMAVENAVVIDAGSAITVDKVQNSKHIGGYIYPGFYAMQRTFKDISPRLDVSFNFDIDLATMPRNTRDALSYGAIATLVSSIREISENMPIIITGGDAEKLHSFIPQAKVDTDLVFKGMKKIIEGVA